MGLRVFGKDVLSKICGRKKRKYMNVGKTEGIIRSFITVLLDGIKMEHTTCMSMINACRIIVGKPEGWLGDI
jgi:hypothetical protein